MGTTAAPSDTDSERKASPAKRRSSKLDAEREDSMADEGGVSAALLEIEDPGERRERHPGSPRRRFFRPWLFVAALGAVATIGWIGGRVARTRFL